MCPKAYAQSNKWKILQDDSHLAARRLDTINRPRARKCPLCKHMETSQLDVIATPLEEFQPKMDGTVAVFGING